MATIGNIGIAFTAETGNLQSGVAGVVSSLEGVQTAADALSARLAPLSSQSIGIKVDTTAIRAATKEVEDLAAETKVSKAIEIDEEETKKTVTKSHEKAQKEADKKKFSFTATIKDSLSSGLKEAKAAADAVVSPIMAAKSAVDGLGKSAKAISSSFGSATQAASLLRDAVLGVGTGGKALRSLVLSANSFIAAWDSTGDGLGEAKSGLTGLIESLSAIADFGGDTAALTQSLSAGAAAFTATSVTAAGAATAISLVEKATSKLDPALQKSVRLLAGLAITAAEAAAAKRLATASSKAFSAVLSAEVSPIAAISAFLSEFSSGLSRVSAESQTAERLLALYAEAAELAGRAMSSAVATAKNLYTAIATGVASLRVFVAETAKSASASAAVRAAYYDLGIVVFAAGDAIASALSSFSAGRAALSLLSKTTAVVSAVFADAVGIAKAFWSGLLAGFSALPGASSAISALSKAFSSLGAALGSITGAATGLKVSFSSLVPIFKIAAVATGAYSQQLKAAADSAESVINLSQRFGTTVASVEILAQAAEGAGVSMGLLVKAQQTLFQNASKIKFGQVDSESVREAQISLSRLGISVQDVQTLKPDQLFSLVAQRIQGVEDAADRAAISFDLFGKAGAAVIPALAGLEEARKDAERFGTVTSEIDLSRLEALDQSFDRLSAASQALAGTLLSPLVPLQTGWNNFLADVKGGLNKLLGPINTVIASATVGFKVVFEVVGRVVNIILRLAGAIAEVATAFLAAPTIAAGYELIGSAIMDVLGLVERLLSVVEKVTGAISSSLVPSAKQLSEVSAPSDSFGDWSTKLLTAGKYLGILVVSMGVAQAAATAFGVTAGGAALSVAAKNLIASISFSGLAKAAIVGFKFVTVGAVQMAASYVASLVTMGTTTIAGFIAPFLASVASFVTGSTVIATSATITGYAVAAAWVIATLGIAALIVGLVALVQNFDKVYDYFANFSENAKKLFTLEGLVDMAKSIGKALWDVFMQIGKGILGWFAGIAQSIADAVMGIETPEIANAAKADAEEIAAVRKKAQDAEYQRAKQIAEIQNSVSRSAAASVGIDLGSVDLPDMPVDETEAVVSAIESSRSAMQDSIIDAAQFGEAGKKAALDAQQQFAKLQEKLALGVLSPEKFEEEAKRIREALQTNLRGLDVLTDSDIFDFAKQARDAATSAIGEFNKVMMGQDLGSTFADSRLFPTSEEIKDEAARFLAEYDKRNKEIAKRLAAGEFGDGRQAQDRANEALAASQEKFRRDMGKIDADVSFASEIRKSLEDAFLTPLQKYEKRLKEIADNKSLTPQEKSLAAVQANQQMVRDTFGQSTGRSLREREELFRKANEVDEFGRTAFFSETGNRAEAEARSSAARTQLDIERRSAAGLDPTAAQSLKAGTDKIADVFNVAGLTIEEIQDKLSPEEFAEYQEALKNNADSVRESLGVEKSGAEKLADSRKKLDDALANNIITAEERDKVLKEQKDALLSSLGIEKSPAQAFEDAVDRIRENAAALSPDEVAKGLKEAKEKLLSSLGIDKSPASAAEDSLKRLKEAFDKGLISMDEFNEGIEKTRDALLQSLGIPLDPVNALRERMNDLREAFSKGLITQEEFAKGQEEARRSMLPGGEEKSPVAQFREDIEAVDNALAEGLISREDAQARRLNLQADLQESLKPALDSVAPDRRLVGASDVRSREGVDTFFRILQGRDNPSLKAQLDIARNTRILAEATLDEDAAPVIAQLSAR